MSEIFIISFFIFFSTFGYGVFLKKLVSNHLEIVKKNYLIIFIFGIFFIQFISIFFNFFFPINKDIATVIFVVGIVLIFTKLKEINYFDIIVLGFAISFISTLVLYKTNLNNDFGLYHGPFLTALQNEKVIFGLSNLHFRFGHISIQQYYEVIFLNNLLQQASPLISIAVIYSTFIVLAANQILTNKEIKFSCLFLLGTIFYHLIRLVRFNDFGNDFYANLIAFIMVYFFLKYFEEKKVNNINIKIDYVLILILLGSILLASKITLIFFLLIPIYISLNKNIFFNIIFSKKILLPLFFIFLFFCKNLINTGCIVYPVSEKLCFKKSLWFDDGKNAHASVKDRNLQSEAWSKDWPNRDISKYKDYSFEYISNFNWLPYWLQNHFKVVLKNISIFFFWFILFIFFSINFKNNNKKQYLSEIYSINFFVIMSICLLGFFFWFFKAPIYRYGYSYLISFIIISILFFSHKKINQSRLSNTIKCFLIFSFLVFASRNFQRIYLNEDNPILPDISYQGKSTFYQYKNFGSTKIRYTLDGVCYFGVPLCTNFSDAVNNIRLDKKFNYLFILPSN